MSHPRLSVHNVTFLGTGLTELAQMWSALGVQRLSMLDTQLLDPQFETLVRDGGHTVEAVYHLFGSTGPEHARDALLRVIDVAAAVRARVIYLLTGGRGTRTWAEAAEDFCVAIAPCVEHARQAGVALAIENASALYADLHLAHTLRDTVDLAERAGLGICVDVFHCWAEADFPALVLDALPRVELIQLSDYVLGDRALPARAVPGDGEIPLEAFLREVLTAGYRHGFDLELIGPRIDAEGAMRAAQRAMRTVGELLTGIGG
ncbi:sugar phosphate isomerase/epimerase family protein [Mycobacterium sp. NPDC003323]